MSSPDFIILETRVNKRLPNVPEGCDLAKSSGVKPRAFKSVIAIASPITKATVVLDVGVRL